MSTDLLEGPLSSFDEQEAPSDQTVVYQQYEGVPAVYPQESISAPSSRQSDSDSSQGISIDNFREIGRFFFQKDPEEFRKTVKYFQSLLSAVPAVKVTYRKYSFPEYLEAEDYY